MAKKTLYLLGILLTIIVGAILYYNYCSSCSVRAVAKTSVPDSTVTAAEPDSVAKKPDSTASTANTTDWNALKEKINADPLVLHFETGHYEISLTAQETQKASDIVNYMKHENSGVLKIVGYSDNVGKRETNIKLSQERAEFAKSYFVKSGIDASKIKTSAKGPDEPIADNTTTEGKSKNRRTVVTIN